VYSISKAAGFLPQVSSPVGMTPWRRIKTPNIHETWLAYGHDHLSPSAAHAEGLRAQM
jgi:hypothetical protein